MSRGANAVLRPSCPLRRAACLRSGRRVNGTITGGLPAAAHHAYGLRCRREHRARHEPAEEGPTGRHPRLTRPLPLYG